MKKIQFSILLFSILFASNLLIAQVDPAPNEDPKAGCDDWWIGNCGPASSIYRNGSVGIGLTAAADSWAKLQVRGNVSVTGSIRGLNSSDQFVIQGSKATDSYYIGSYFQLYGEESTFPGRVTIGTRGDDAEFKIVHNNHSAGTWVTNFRVKPDGKVIIGGENTAEPSAGYRLAVAEGIQTQRVKVCASASAWCDYVFEKDYERKSIKQVENYIAENKHLPNVPSAKEVEENGINVAEMDATLLRQIEELWLHIIDLKKENEALKKEVNNLKSTK